jgi:hypothetical protein
LKRFVLAAFLAFWAAAASIVVLGRRAPLAPPPPAAGEPRRVSLAELARHSTAEDCWMAVEGKVYDATEYAPRHPAPPRVLLDWCGREATEAFRTKGVGRPHSRAAWAMLARMEVGLLDAR